MKNEKHPNFFKIVAEDSLLKQFSQIHNFIYANDGLSSQQALDEMLKIMFVKVFDENEKTKQFYVTEEEFTEIKNKQDSKTFTKRLNNLFSKTVLNFIDIFDKSERLKLSNNSLAYSVKKLQTINFADTKDAKGLAFQKFLAAQEKSSRGQFFTPEPIIDFCVNLLAPKPNEKIIDPTCGSGGFLFAAYSYLLQNYKLSKKKIVSNLYGIDINKTIVKIAKMKLLLECNTNLNIAAQNSLDDFDKLESTFGSDLENAFDIILTNPPFGTVGKIDSSKQLSKFELGYKWTSDGNNYYKTKILHNAQTPETLFIERCLHLLKEGGRMAIVLPNGHFENSSLEYVRIFIKQKARVLAVVNLPQETFIPFGTGVKTSILFLVKEAKKAGKKQVFFGRVTKLGYQGNKNGNSIYLKDTFGSLIKDKNNQQVLDEDFSVVLSDFKDFQKKGTIKTENSFSFPFDELNGRFDFDYYSPQNRSLLTLLKKSKAVQLSEICDISKQKSKKLCQTDVPVDYVELSDINTHSFEIINSTSYPVHELPSRASYEIKEGDIITAVAGNSIGTAKHASALVVKNYEGCVCTNGFRVLRNFKIDPYYFLYYLKTEMFLKQIFMYRTGAAIPSISDRDLERTLIYLPSENEIQEISKKVRNSFELRKKASQQLKEISIQL
jgi:type I restriction enzyme M protein